MLAGGFLQDHRVTTAPLLDQAEFAEHATDHAREIVEAQARDQHTRVLSLDSVVEEALALDVL